jgi:capsular polysaccharide biosynthesis protein
MTQQSWSFEEGPEDEIDARTAQSSVTFRYLLDAIRRRLALCVLAAVVGTALGAGFAAFVPAPSQGTVSLFLAHDPAMDPTLAMATDVSFLRTRAVANRVVDELGLELSPERFQQTVEVEPATTSVLVLTVTGRDDADARHRARVLADHYLDFRRSQLEAQSNALVSGHERQVESLQAQVDLLTERYADLVSSSPAGGAEASAVLTERSQLSSEIIRLQQLIEDTSLESTAIVTASHVLDPAAVVPTSQTKRTALAAMSGLIGGAALGLALVIFSALTTDRLRRREDIGMALGVPVRASVRRLGASGLGSRRLHPDSPTLGLQVLLHALEAMFVPRGADPIRLALVAATHDADYVELTAAAGIEAERRGQRVFLVDLSPSGSLLSTVNRHRTRELATESLVVFRPGGVPQLARGPLRLPAGASSDLPDGRVRQAFDRADVVVTLVEADPAMGIDELATWADRVVVLVTAGGSTAERLRAIGELIRSTGLVPEFALLLGADASDESLGPQDGDTPRRGGQT